MREARRVRVTGVVQGVGFRPFVQRLSVEHGVLGWVRNALGNVEIHVEGECVNLDAFVAELEGKRPTLARIDAVSVTPAPMESCTGFAIRESVVGVTTPLPVPADVVMCDACAAELSDQSSRRYQYPFTTCTDCGPRYTVIESLPYDRERTTLRAFPMCPECRAEYTSVGDRRFHAESIACPSCGPHLAFETMNGAPRVAGDAASLDAAAAGLLRGEIVAIRGLGGFHLAVDATNSDAVARLRARKHREAKPLACMIENVEVAASWVNMTAAERSMLTSRERPIVLLTPMAGVREQLAEGLAPGLDRIGIMLPSTPLHLLLLRRVQRPLVMTSGNLSDEPLASGNDEARERLATIADAFLTHDREIAARIDDSVVRLAGELPVVMRRARGLAPLSHVVPVASPMPLLATGAHLKNTFTLLHGQQAFVSPHIGDLDTLDALAHWNAVRARYQTLFGIVPQAIVADLHDGYLSTREAERLHSELPEAPLLRVQHHHAHIAAVAAEHGVTSPVLGIALDGTGAGPDGTVWGGEFLHADLTGFARVGHFRTFVLPGGELAVRSPWRALLGLRSLDVEAFSAFDLALPSVSATERQVAQRQIERGINAPVTSSAGRLFDAIASLLGLCHHARFEGEAAMLLEAAAGQRVGRTLPFPVTLGRDGVRQLDPVPLLLALYERQSHGTSVHDLAADAHESVCAGLLEMTMQLADERGTTYVALGGGCFQNARLLHRLTGKLRTAGLRPLTARALPANDGGVSFGQAAIAAARLSAEVAPEIAIPQQSNGALESPLHFDHSFVTDALRVAGSSGGR